MIKTPIPVLKFIEKFENSSNIQNPRYELHEQNQSNSDLKRLFIGVFFKSPNFSYSQIKGK